jgi:hypothetical protein
MWGQKGPKLGLTKLRPKGSTSMLIRSMSERDGNSTLIIVSIVKQNGLFAVQVFGD